MYILALVEKLIGGSCKCSSVSFSHTRDPETRQHGTCETENWVRKLLSHNCSL